MPVYIAAIPIGTKTKLVLIDTDENVDFGKIGSFIYGKKSHLILMKMKKEIIEKVVLMIIIFYQYLIKILCRLVCDKRYLKYLLSSIKIDGSINHQVYRMDVRNELVKAIILTQLVEPGLHA